MATPARGAADYPIGALEGWALAPFSWDGSDASWDGADPISEPAESPCGYAADSDCDYLGDTLESTYTVRCGEDWSKSVAVRRLVDIDGDGLQDIVQLDSEAEIPDAYYPLTHNDVPQPLCDSVFAADLYDSGDGDVRWTVYYGERGGFAADGVEIDPPVDFPRVGTSPVYKERLSSTVPAVEDTDDAYVDLMDIDGDGWLDVVQATGYGELRVWFHEGTRDGGWAALPVDAASGSDLASTMRSLEMTRQYLDAAQWYPYGASWHQTTVKVEFTESVAGFRDVNGDGQPDYVDASEWTESFPFWQVNLGTGSRGTNGFLDSMRWRAPRGWLSRSDEGSPAVLSCVASAYSGGPSEEGPQYGLRGTLFPPGDDVTPTSDGGVSFKVGIAFDFSCSFADATPDTGGVYDWTAHGRSQKQVGGLLDVDGDGRMDLVDVEDSADILEASEGSFEVVDVALASIPCACGTDHPHGRWWRNTGAGFAEVAFDAPSWFHGSLSSAVSRQLVAITEEAATDGPAAPDEGQIYPSSAQRHVLHVVMDLDRDGLPDAIDGIDPDDPDDEGSITYAPRGDARPGLLTSIQTTFGTTTELEYASTATLSPSGTDDWHEMNQHRDVIESVRVTDPVTGNAAERRFTYMHGRCEYGQCLGFEQQEIEEYVYDADIHDSNDLQLQSVTATDYLLDRDHALATDIVVYVNDSDPTPVEDPDSTPVLRMEVSYARSYDEVAFAGEGSDGAFTVVTRWLSQQEITEYPVDFSDDDRSWTVAIERDPFGNPEEVTHTVAGCTPVVSSRKLPAIAICRGHEDDVKVTTEYTSDAAHTWFLPSSMSTYQRDTSSGGWDEIEHGEFAYDDRRVGAELKEGLLTKQTVDSGVGGALASESLVWAFDRNDRGAITRLDAPGGRVQIVTHTFGDALPDTEENGVGHIVQHAYDGLGHEIETIDPNGVVSTRELDAFGRLLEQRLTPADGLQYLVAEHTYVDTPGAAAVSVSRYSYETPGGAALERVEHQVLDGFGQVLQVWTPAETTSEWLVQETISDIAGNAVRTSYPHREAAFAVDFEGTREHRFTTWSALDAFGRARETWEDHEEGLGHVELSYPLPGWTDTVDSDYYRHMTHSDTHDRLVEVFEGRLVSMRQTATWKYDGRNRVTGFEDANGNAYQYEYDGAGRLRTVNRDAGTSTSHRPAAAWYSYEYDGPDPIEMWEGRASAGTLVAEWDHDSIGRPTAKLVLDRASGDFDTYGWVWDTGWLGARGSITDPSGQVDYEYEASDFGRMGRPSSMTRSWTDGGSATFAYDYDFDGHAITTVWPSGSIVTADYTETGWLSSQAASWSGGSADVTYEYDAWGLNSGWRGGELWRADFEARVVRDTPTRLSSTTWELPGGGSRGLLYAWEDNGLLDAKVLLGFPGGTVAGVGEAFDYDYDAWKRVTEMASSTKTLESYAYDAIGNLTEMYREGEGTWVYDPAAFSEVSLRTNASTGLEHQHTWDEAGRMASWETVPALGPVSRRSYRYDGAGRLVGIETSQPSPRKKAGTILSITAYGYDVDDQMVREIHSDGREILRFQGWREDDGKVIEKLLPIVSLEGGSARWTLLEPDGHALGTYDSDGNELSLEVLGLYGLAAETYTAGEWAIDAFHGSDPDRANDTIHMGARHLLLRDGLWMQPEPYLYAGPTNGDLANPAGYTGLYAGGNTLAASDRTGRWFPSPESLTPDPGADVARSADQLVSDLQSGQGPITFAGPWTDAGKSSAVTEYTRIMKGSTTARSMVAAMAKTGKSTYIYEGPAPGHGRSASVPAGKYTDSPTDDSPGRATSVDIHLAESSALTEELVHALDWNTGELSEDNTQEAVLKSGRLVEGPADYEWQALGVGPWEDRKISINKIEGELDPSTSPRNTYGPFEHVGPE